MTAARVLIVEDEALIADDLERTLLRYGFEVAGVVDDGESAVAAARDRAPSLALVDIKLRGRMDGVEAARQIRDRYEIPVVFLTSHTDPGTLARAGEVRPQGFLTKPFVEADLRVAVELAVHKHAVEQRHQQRDRWFATALRAITDAVIVVDDAWRVRVTNPAAEALLGSRGPLVGAAVGEVVPLGRGREALSPGIEGPRTWADVLVGGEEPVPVDVSVAPILEPAPRSGAVIVLRDQSQRRALEERVARAERLAALGTMAAGICHEVNSPLTSVLANVDFALQGLSGAGEELRGALADARESAERIARIVRDVGTLVRPGGGGPPVELGPLIERSLRLAAPRMAGRARTSVRLDPAPRVAASPDRLVQLLVNLLVNAAQAIPEGRAGAVRVSLAADPAGWARVEVTDDGAGIPPADLPRLFDPFFTTKAPGHGMGLGLAICASIAAEAGGELTAANVPAGGATFVLRLPPAPEEGGAPAPGHVVVVDDDPAVSRALARGLSGRGPVRGFVSPQAALEHLRVARDVGAVVCDLMMPGLSGMDLYDRLLVDRPDLADRFVFVTGGATTPAASEFLARAGLRVLFKGSFDLDELRAEVAARVGRG